MMNAVGRNSHPPVYKYTYTGGGGVTSIRRTRILFKFFTSIVFHPKHAEKCLKTAFRV